MQNALLRQGLVFGIIFLFFSTSIGLNIGAGNGTTKKIEYLQNYSSAKSSSYPLGGECDLHFDSVTYYPNPPIRGQEFTIYIIVTDKLGNYNDSHFDIQLISDIPLNRTYHIPFDGQEHHMSFNWPVSEETNYIKLTIFPNEMAGWNETNWNDNTYTLDDISPDITPIFFLGSINNVTEESNIIRFNAISVMYIELPFYIGYLRYNEKITIPKSIFGFVGKQFIIGLFL